MPDPDAVLFFRRVASGGDSCRTRLPTGYRIVVWHPNGWQLCPPELRRWRLFAWNLLYALQGDRSSLGVVMVLDHSGRLAHSAVVQRRYFRLNFMGARDMMVGSLFTPPAERG